MIAYALRRLLRIPLVLIVTFVPALVLVRAAPLGPWDPNRRLPLAVEAALAGACPADEPLASQLARATLTWIRLEVDGCTGVSLRDATPVLTLVGRALPVSAALALAAVALAACLGLLVGAWLARGSHHLGDRLGSASLAVVEAMPPYVLAPLSILVGSFGLGLFAPARLLSSGAWTVPVLALAAPSIASVARRIRDALRDPAAAARRQADLARGFSRRRAELRALRLALLPLAAHLGPVMSAAVMGGMAVELVFDVPGLGPLLLEAAGARDTNVLLGGVFAYGALVLVTNLGVELAYGLLDPRVRSAR